MGLRNTHEEDEMRIVRYTQGASAFSISLFLFISFFSFSATPSFASHLPNLHVMFPWDRFPLWRGMGLSFEGESCNIPSVVTFPFFFICFSWQSSE